MGLNHAQRLALNLDSHLVIDAGAGTGKTKTIVDRVIEHYLTPIQRASVILPRPYRPGRLAGGMIVDGNAHRIDLNEWSGLLPTEVIVLTFTNAAAEELKHRIRIALGELRAGTTSGKDEDGADSRIIVQGLPDQFRMLLEDAPIGTIDSFFTRLVSPHRALLGLDVTDEQVSETQRVSLETLAVNTAWRLPYNNNRRGEAVDAGIPSEILDQFFEARRRVSQTVGSTHTCRRILKGMLSRSVFLDGAVEQLYDPSIDSVSPDLIRREITSWLDEDHIFQTLNRLQTPLAEWLELIENAGAIEDTDSGTRLAALDHALSLPPPADSWEALVRIFHLFRITSSQTGARADGGNGLTGSPSLLPRGYLPPNTDAWERGHSGYPKISEELKSLATKAKYEWSKQEHLFERKIAFIVGLLDDSIPTHMPSDYPIRPQIIDIPTSYSGRNISDGRRFDLVQEATMLNDLWIVHRATAGILRKLKSTRGLHDFEDISELAGDLLLSRCPQICRTFYSEPIIQSLDQIDIHRPWSDTHLDRSLELAQEAMEDPTSLGYANTSEAEKALVDLIERIDLLKRIRRRYLAMILDEAQDINPRQWRLLSRLWGPRLREESDLIPDQNLEWEPTVCYVGDIKQSIYLFRQAQVSTFHRFADHLRRINNHELSTLDIFKEPNPLRTMEWSRDPRALHDSFVRASMHSSENRKLLNPEVRFDGTDGVHQISSEEISLRRSGHVRLSINYRTSGGLLRVMDRWWKDVFHSRHQTFSNADWYAEDQQLTPSPEKENDPGILEWLLPIGPLGINQVPSDPTHPIDLFLHGKANKKELESSLIVERIRALVDGSDCKIGHSSGDQQHIIESTAVDPSDIMVLLPSRKHYLESILNGLSALGIPVQADKEGALFSRPSVRPLLGLVQLCARPHHRHHASWVARSVLVGLNDDELDRFIRNSPKGSNLIERMVDFAHTEQQSSLIQGWYNRVKSGRIIELLDWTIDHSDLLLAYPMDSDRIDAENFVDFIRNTLQESGGDIVLLADRLARIERDGDGAAAKDISSSGGVRIMTIHKSKGLQSKVVILAGIFGQSQTRLIHENQDRLIVTPQMFGVHPKPWLDQKDPISSVWNYIKILHESQVQAEARRLLYVAATRAEDRLIISGAPNGTLFSNSGIKLEVEHGSTPSFGSMLLESMRQSSTIKNVNSPWLIGNEKLGVELTSTPKKYQLTIDPVFVSMNSRIGVDKGIGIRIYHSPECFEDRTIPKTVFRSMFDLSETLNDIKENGPSSTTSNPREIILKSNISPSSLDIANTCMRKYWLENRIGLKQEINLLGNDRKIEENILPAANVLGTIVHRLVEIGVPSPRRSPDSLPLPIEWTKNLGSRWQGNSLEKAMDEVFQEFLTSNVDIDQTKKLVTTMISNLDNSELGQFLNNFEGKMGTLDGVRTELPFGMELDVNSTPLEISQDTPRGLHIFAIAEKKVARLSGLIDLVIAYQCPENKSKIMPIDLKTEDAKILLKSNVENQGTLLEIMPAGEISDAEKSIIMKHRHQLFIYHYALELQESIRASNGLQRRIVENPAIWVGVSGRLVQMSDEIMSLVESELHPLLNEMIAIDYGIKKDPSSFICSNTSHHCCQF